MDATRIASYVLGDKLHRGVPGWLNEGAISAVIAFAKWQDENCVVGDVAEIGVHHGKFFILLANLRHQHERAFAIDVFDDQHLNPDNSGRGDLSRFKENVNFLADDIGVAIIQRDSKTLTRADFYRGRRGSIRLFSIDGSHTAAHTASDLTIAAQLLAADGLIILDDFYNPDWPGVQEGFYHFLTNSDLGIVPFAYGNHKLYLCGRASHGKYLSFVENDLRPFLLHYKQVEIGGLCVVHFSCPPPELVFRPNLCLIPNVFPLRAQIASPEACFGTGWAPLQANGVWTLGPRSELRLKLLPIQNDAPTLRIEVEPFLHKTRASRRLGIILNDHNLGEYVFDETSSKSLEVLLPPGALQTDCYLQFDIEEPDRPSETIGTSDDRPLGFFFQQIRIA
jgi:hypothetical protein